VALPLTVKLFIVTFDNVSISTETLSKDTLAIEPPVMVTLAKEYAPLPILFTAIATVLKLASNSDNGIDVVALANWFGIVIGNGI
jgi:hypothetical protein